MLNNRSIRKKMVDLLGQVFQIWKTSETTYLLVVWKSSGLLGSLLTKSSGLPGSRLDFSERFDLEVFWDDLLVSRLEVVLKSSESRLDFLRLDFLKVVWSCLLKWNPSLSL
ncbi:hypothetical protein YC2023_076530 [Brassica napus]